MHITKATSSDRRNARLWTVHSVSLHSLYYILPLNSGNWALSIDE